MFSIGGAELSVCLCVCARVCVCVCVCFVWSFVIAPFKSLSVGPNSTFKYEFSIWLNAPQMATELLIRFGGQFLLKVAGLVCGRNHSYQRLLQATCAATETTTVAAAAAAPFTSQVVLSARP